MRPASNLLMLGVLLAPLGSACSRTTIESRIVGTWEAAIDLSVASRMPKILEHTGSSESADAIMKKAREQLAADGELPLRNTYASDGTFVLNGSILGHPVHEVHRWRLIADQHDRVTIEIEDMRDSHKGEKTQQTFVFEQPDLIREEGGLMGGMRYRLLK